MPSMIVNLDKASSIVISGSRVQVHFQDTSIHMRKFHTRRELNEILDGWERETRVFRVDEPSLTGEIHSSGSKRA